MRPSCQGVVSYIASRYACCAEIGVGAFPDVALALVRSGVTVLATDVKPFEHIGVEVVYDDIMAPDLSLYAEVDCIYSLRPPPELIPYMAQLANKVISDLIVKPLASDYPEGGRLTGRGSTAFFLWRSL